MEGGWAPGESTIVTREQQANKRKERGIKRLRKLFAKRWHSIPVALLLAVLALVAVAGGVLAAYQFQEVNVTMEVREPMVVTIDLGWDDPDAGPVTLPSPTFTLDDACTAGDVGTIDVWVENGSSGDITVSTALSGAYGNFTFTGLPNGVIAAETTWHGVVEVKVANDAVPGNYSYTIAFSRS